MKCVSTLDVNMYGSIKVKRCTLVLTSQRANANLKEWIKEEEQASFYHIIVQEPNNLDSKKELAEAPKKLEDGGKPLFIG